MRSGIDCKGNEWSERNLGKMKNLVGTRFTKLEVLFPVHIQGRSKQHYYWLCKCDCGKYIACRSDCLQNNHIQSCGCMIIEGVYKKSQDISNCMIGKRFGKLVVDKFVGYKTGNNGIGKAMYQCVCDCGNDKFVVMGNSLNSGLTLSCGCITRSIGEENIEAILNENNIRFKSEYSFSDLQSYNDRCLRYDFVILDENDVPIRLIEYDGEQHFKPVDRFGGVERFEIQKINDALKNQYAISHDIPLVRIHYSLRNNITIQDLLGDKYVISKNQIAV